MLSPPAGGQVRSAAEHLNAGVVYLESGDYLIALMTLNEVVGPDSKAVPAVMARAHAYRAQANFGLNQPERARAAALLALKADATIEVKPPSFSSAVITLFDELRRPAVTDPEAIGRAEETAGRYQQAFLAYLSAYERIAEPPPPADDSRLRERIMAVARLLEAEPVIPAEAKAHLLKADELLAAEQLLGGSGAASSQAAAVELRQAIRIAPWWPEAAFRLAGVLQKLQRLDEAVINLNLYRLADPEGYAAAVAARGAAPADKPRGRIAPPRPTSVAPVASATATLYVYWPPQARGAGRPKVRCDGHHVADLQSGRFVTLNVPAGARNISFHNKTYPFSFESGGTYYLRAAVEGFPNTAIVRVIASSEGAAEMRDKGVTTNDPLRTYSSDCAAGASRR
jgi:tetratricopeptide (TPR) repeat protein